MGFVDTLVNSVVQLVAGLLGFGMLISGAQQSAYGSQTVGTIVFLLGIVLIIFAARV